MNVTGRLQKYIRARKNAKLFGLPYFRARDFDLPDEILLRNERVGIRHLGSHGTRADFFVCMIYDDYRLRELARRGLSTIIDIGANQGFFALAARVHSPASRIFCYEPNDRLRDILLHNAELCKSTVFFEAVGNSRGICKLNLASESNQTTTEVVSEGDRGVPQVAFSEVVDRVDGRVSLLKMDCEGAEWAIMESEAMESVDAITMEYHLSRSPGLAHKDAVERVRELGFFPVHVSHGETTGDIVAIRRNSTARPN